jgi:multidrug efflux system membrane fusion protein
MSSAKSVLLKVFGGGALLAAGYFAATYGPTLKTLTSSNTTSTAVAMPKTTPAPGKASAPTPNVTASKPLVRTVIEWDEYTGRFDAIANVEIRARVSGYLDQVHFIDGQNVKKGDVLYSIDPRPFERAVDQAKAELAQASTKVENSSLDVERGQPLLDRKIMSAKTFDDRANAMRDAQAQVKVSEAKLRTAELDLTFTKMTSPITGRISRSAVTAGSWVSAGAAANSTLMTSIVSEDPIHIYFDISENNWIKYKRMVERGQKEGAAQLGSQVEIALPDETGYPHKGKVDFVDNRLDQATGTMRGRAIVDNKTGTLSAGMFARVRVQGSEAFAAIMLPDEAIGTDQTNKFVFTVAEDGTVGRTVVQLGPVIDGLRVVRSGISADDLVITKGLQRARAGIKVAAKVEPIKVSASSNGLPNTPSAAAPPVATPLAAPVVSPKASPTAARQ